MPRSTHLTLLLSLLLALPLYVSTALAADAPSSSSLPWNSAQQGGFILSLARDKQQNLWVASEDDGLFRYTPATGKWK